MRYFILGQEQPKGFMNLEDIEVEESYAVTINLWKYI